MQRRLRARESREEDKRRRAWPKPRGSKKNVNWEGKPLSQRGLGKRDRLGTCDIEEACDTEASMHSGVLIDTIDSHLSV